MGVNPGKGTVPEGVDGVEGEVAEPDPAMGVKVGEVGAVGAAGAVGVTTGGVVLVDGSGAAGVVVTDPLGSNTVSV